MDLTTLDHDLNGVWYEASTTVNSIVEQYFGDLLTISHPQRNHEIFYCVEARLSENDNKELVRLSMDDEIRRAAFPISASQSLGPDGFSSSLYHEFWDVVGVIL